MRVILLCVLLVLAIGFGVCQESQSGQTGNYTEKVEQLLEKQRFATAHMVYDSAVARVGFQPSLVCDMLENVLHNYFFEENMETFYLADSLIDSNGAMVVPRKSAITAVYYPDRMLTKLLQKSPQYARAHKLMGDFYRLQLQDKNSGEMPNGAAWERASGQVLKHYLRAAELGYSDPEVNFWIGEAYMQMNQAQKAKEFFLREIADEQANPAAYVYLAGIFFDEKQYSKSVDYASEALRQSEQLTIRQQYRATQIAALSFFHLGDETRFEEYMTRCIHFFPDRQDAYIDLLSFYHSRDEHDRERELIRRMLLNNPYRTNGYKYLEKFSLRNNEFGFADSLFEDLIMKFEIDEEVLGNVYRFRGNLVFHQGMNDEARNLWEISRNYYRYLFPEDDLRIREVGDVSRDSSMK